MSSGTGYGGGWSTPPDQWENSGGVNTYYLFQSMDTMEDQVNDQLDQMAEAGCNVSTTDMFQMQLLMNELSEFTAMSSSVLSNMHQSIKTFAQSFSQ